jgi:hypothetical protein
MISSGAAPAAPDLAQYSSIAVGPVEWVLVDGTNASIAVLGQTFATIPEVARSVAVGDYVVATGNAGDLAGVFEIGQAYLPGVSPVAVRGAVGSVDPSRGTMSVGALTINYASYLVSDPQFEPQVDQVVEVDGIQPAASSSLLAFSSDHAVVSEYQINQ